MRFVTLMSHLALFSSCPVMGYMNQVCSVGMGTLGWGEFVILQQLENRSKFVQHVRAGPFHASNETKLACDNNGVVFSHFVELKNPNLCDRCTSLGKKKKQPNKQLIKNCDLEKPGLQEP